MLLKCRDRRLAPRAPVTFNVLLRLIADRRYLTPTCIQDGKCG